MFVYQIHDTYAIVDQMIKWQEKKKNGYKIKHKQDENKKNGN